MFVHRQIYRSTAHNKAFHALKHRYIRIETTASETINNWTNNVKKVKVICTTDFFSLLCLCIFASYSIRLMLFSVVSLLFFFGSGTQRRYYIPFYYGVFCVFSSTTRYFFCVTRFLDLVDMFVSFRVSVHIDVTVTLLPCVLLLLLLFIHNVELITLGNLLVIVCMDSFYWLCVCVCQLFVCSFPHRVSCLFRSKINESNFFSVSSSGSSRVMLFNEIEVSS